MNGAARRLRRRAYNIWYQMHQRCENPGAISYPVYGAKGISVDPRWATFPAFLEDMGHPPDGFQLDRIDGTRGYSPENCRWSSRADNQNNRSNTTRLTLNDETLPVGEWAKRQGLTTKQIHARLHAGWSVERTLTEALHVR